MFVILVAVGCASRNYGLYRPGATEAEFTREETQCRRELGLGGGNALDPSQILVFFVARYKNEVRDCLLERGWKLRP